MSGMSNILKPVIVIVLAVAVAAGAAMFLSRGSEAPSSAADAAAPVADLSGGGQSIGPADAEVTLVEFGDYQCPSCAAYHPFVKEVLNRYPKQVRFQFHHFPLVSIHPNALAAHKAAEAAALQGRFWEMHNALFEYQTQWASRPDPKPVFAAIANQIGINGAILVQQMESPDIQARVLRDVQRGDKANVQATPTFLINGRQVPLKLSVQDFVQVIEAQLNAQ
jgi:protein-disulfide isomerase